MRIKELKSCVTLALSLFMVSTVTVNATEIADVTFDNTSQLVTKGDLFDNFKGVMPGDKLTDVIVIQNDCSEYDYVKVYMRADANTIDNIESVDSPTQADVDSMNAFLSQLDMEVMLKDKGQTEIFQDSPDKQGTLTDNVLLGVMKRDESISFDVNLNVPIEMDNEFATRIGEVDWIFTIEGYDDPENNGVQTGDESKIGLYLIIGVIALGGIGFVLYRREITNNK